MLQGQTLYRDTFQTLVMSKLEVFQQLGRGSGIPRPTLGRLA